MGFHISFGVLVMLCSAPVYSFNQGQLILPPLLIPKPIPVLASGSHSGFGSALPVLALLAIILKSPRIPSTTTSPPLEGCPLGYILYSDRCGPFCYRFENQTCVNFVSARASCARDGGDLLNVDPCYYEFFRDLAEQDRGCDEDVWIGASSATPIVNYITVRGDSVPEDSVLWGTNEPRSERGGGCVEMEARFRFRLDDQRCSSTSKYICQVFI